MKKIFYINVIICLWAFHAFAQQQNKSSYIDSVRISQLLSEKDSKNDERGAEQKVLQAQTIAINSKTEWILPWCLIRIANIYTSKGYSKDLIFNLLLRAEKHINTHDIDNEHKIDLLFKIANVYSKHKNYAVSINVQKNILLLHPDKETTVGIYGNLGVIYSQIHDYTNSLKYYQSALKIIDENDGHSREKADSATLSALEITIGEIYLDIKQFDKALQHFNMAEEYAKSGISTLLQNELTIRKCKTYIGMHSYNIALQLLLELNESLKKDDENELIVNTLLVTTYIKLDSLDVAANYLTEALKLNGLPNFFDLNSRLLIYKGFIYAHNHQYAAAIQYYQEAIKACASNNELTDALDAWEALYQLYDQQHETAKSYDAYKQYIAVKEQINQLNKTNEILRLELMSDFNKKQLGDSLLQANAYNLKIQKQQAFTYSGFIGLVLVIVLTFFIYRNYTTQKKYNAILHKEKVQHLADIDAQKTVLTDIAYVQSHEIRGPISTIMGLVQIFNFDKPEDPMNKELLEGIYEVTQRLDQKVQEVVQKENALHAELNKRSQDKS